MKKKLLFILIYVSNYMLSQNNISGILMSQDGVLIKQAVIGIEGENTGTTSNNEGVFNLSLENYNQKKNILVKVNGFQPYQISIEDFIKQSSNKIILIDKITDIEPVQIVYKKKYIYKNWGNNNSTRGYSEFNSKQITKETAVKFDNKYKIRINKINIGVTKLQIAKPMTIIFDIYDSKDGFPNQSLSPKVLALVISNENIKEGNFSLDISKENIWIKDDFFVSIRLGNDFDGSLALGGNIYAFSKDTYYRQFYGGWKKFSAGVPAINIDVIIDK